MRIFRHRVSAHHVFVAVLLGVSALATLGGMAALTRFDQTAGSAGAAPSRWPFGSGVRRTDGRAEILVFAHPFCSCTEATVAELRELAVHRNASIRAPHITFLFFRPRTSGWVPNALWKAAQSLERASVRWDDDGQEARRFGAEVSGYALLYSRDGRLLFHGGITGSRGHEGGNYGLDELIHSMNSNRPAHASTQVFGCALGNWGRLAGKS